MKTVVTLDAWRQQTDEWRGAGKTVALVPTMGALHDGHCSLVTLAAQRADYVALTNFVNPLQFNDEDDLRRYPRDPAGDAEAAAAAGVDLYVTPDVAAMWPTWAAPTTYVHVPDVGDEWEGAQRPGHFDGVATVVAKLLHVHGPGPAIFGEKDFQQVAVVERMVADLALPNPIVRGPIYRDADGLATSSRNRRLSAEGRRRALVVGRVLGDLATNARSTTNARNYLQGELADSGLDVAYAEIVQAATLRRATASDVERRAIVAVVVDGVRLIDNGPVAGGPDAVSD